MRLEKQSAKMEYWKVIDDHWSIPVLIGIEHDGKEVQAIMVNNPNGKGFRTLGGAELLAVMKAIDELKVKVKDIDMKMFYTT